MGNYFFQLYKPQEIIDKNNKIYNEFLENIISLDKNLELVIKNSSKMNIYKILSKMKFDLNMILNLNDLDKGNEIAIKKYDIIDEDLKQRVNIKIKSIKKKVDIIEKIIINSNRKCLDSYNELVKIESNVLEDKNKNNNINNTINKLKIEDSINSEFEIVNKNCNFLYFNRSLGKFVNIKDTIKTKNQSGGEINFEEKYKKYKKKYKYLKKSNLYNNNGK